MWINQCSVLLSPANSGTAGSFPAVVWMGGATVWSNAQPACERACEPASQPASRSVNQSPCCSPPPFPSSGFLLPVQESGDGGRAGYANQSDIVPQTDSEIPGQATQLPCMAYRSPADTVHYVQTDHKPTWHALSAAGLGGVVVPWQKW
ncbi:hypothetical protein GQ53DRAFT_96677 [Thozetella sp. PMI_491]|nr:hypothetical protein GQ53DRAFT_96677 [Thozetella sp. PMI_491]